MKAKYDKKEYLFCCLITFIWGMVAHAYAFLNNNISHDWLNAFNATHTEELWKIELGRFIVPIYRQIVRDSIALPWLIGLIAILFLSIAVFILVKLFDIKSKPLIVLVSGIMVTNITVTAQCATYLYELDINMLALVLALLGAYIWYNYNDIKWYCVCIICLIVSIGIYQSYLSVTITIMLVMLISKVLKEEKLKHIVIKGSWGIIVLSVSCVVYYLCSKVVCYIFNVELQSRTDVMSADNVEYIRLFFDTYKHFIDYIQHNVYPRWLIISILIYISIVLFFIMCLTIRKVSKRGLAYVVIYITLILLIPFGSDIVFFLVKGNNVHDLMTYAIWMLFALFAVVIYIITNSKEYSLTGNKVIRIVGVVLLCLMLWQNITISNTAYLKKDMEATATLSVMTRVVSEVENTEGYIHNETPVAFIGGIDCIKPIEGFEKVQNVTGLWGNNSIYIDSSTYYYNAYKAYFAYVLKYPISFCGDDLHEELKNNMIVAEMPTFPNKGSIVFVDNVLVIKMGK